MKSGYWAAIHDLRDDEGTQSPPGSVSLKNEVWKLQVLPKIKQFLWNVISGAVPTYVQLCSRGVKVDPICQRCCYEEETINHALFKCPHAFAIWRCSNSPLVSQFSDNLEDNLGIMLQLMKDLNEDKMHRLQSFWTLWYIWKSRNEFIFIKRNVHPMEDARRAKEANDEWASNVLSTVRSLVRVSRQSTWDPPPLGWLKCNFNCSYKRELSETGIGWILRDHDGKFISCGGARIYGIQSSLEGEGNAFLYAVQQIWVQGCRRVWFEGDNQQLVNIVNGYQDNVELGNLVFDIRHWIKLLPECSLDYVNRERNQAADCMAKKMLEENEDSVVFKIPPIWMVNYLYYPYTI